MLLRSARLQRYCATVCDLVALISAWYITLLLMAGSLRASSSLRSEYEFLLAGVLVFWIPITRSLHIYAAGTNTPGSVSLLRAVAQILVVMSLALFLGFTVTDLRSDMARSFVYRFAPLSCFAVCVMRKLGWRAVIGAISRWPRKPCVAVIAERVDAAMADRLREVKSAVLKGVIVPQCAVSDTHQLLPVLGNTRDLAAVINRERLDGIILVNGALPEADIRACNVIAKRMRVPMDWVLPLPEPVSPNIRFAYEFGMHVLEMTPVSLTRGERLVKRAFDLILASLFIVLLAPFMAVIAVLVRTTSEGAILYRAARVGRGGRYFTFIKFRTMYANVSRRSVQKANEKEGHIFKIRQDPRVTPVGRFLRRYSLDELPQLFNVLAGDMSLVGPRPLPVEDMDPDGLSTRFALWSEQRASVPPGITGLWQIRGRSELPFTDLVKYDLEYVHNWSLILDLKILLQTPAFVLSGMGAY